MIQGQTDSMGQKDQGKTCHQGGGNLIPVVPSSNETSTSNEICFFDVNLL